MTHKVEIVTAAIVAKVTGLLTTAGNVKRGDPYVVQSKTMPCLNVEQGAETKDAEYANSEADWILPITIIGTVKANEGYEQTLSAIREEVTIAILSDLTLGLDFINSITEENPSEIEIHKADKVIARQEWPWLFNFRRNVNNPSL